MKTQTILQILAGLAILGVLILSGMSLPHMMVLVLLLYIRGLLARSAVRPVEKKEK
jgi:hypothetical protein